MGSTITMLIVLGMMVVPTIVLSVRRSRKIKEVEEENERLRKEIKEELGEKEFNQMIISSITKEDVNAYFREEYNKQDKGTSLGESGVLFYQIKKVLE